MPIHGDPSASVDVRLERLGRPSSAFCRTWLYTASIAGDMWPNCARMTQLGTPFSASLVSAVWRRELGSITGLTGEFSFHFEYDPAGVTRPTLFNAVEGLEFEHGEAPVEVWSIERAERPSEN